jgi:hypothetical protein
MAGESIEVTKWIFIGLFVMLLYFMLSPGVIWSFPESDTCEPDKVNVMFHGVLFTVILLILLPYIFKMAVKVTGGGSSAVKGVPFNWN